MFKTKENLKQSCLKLFACNSLQMLSWVLGLRVENKIKFITNILLVK